MLPDYLKEIFSIYKGGQAREESYYGALAQLLKSHDKRAEVLVLPKKTEAGNPDFRVALKVPSKNRERKEKEELVGYIEAKDIGSDLNKVESSEQLKRYLNAWPNVILTNFTEFRLYRDGKKVLVVNVTRQQLWDDINHPSPVEHAQDFEALLGQFFTYRTPQAYTPEQLARLLAEKTRYLKYIAYQALADEHLREGDQTLEALYGVLKRNLIASLSEDDFADLFAQTVTYGLFAARSRESGEFDRYHAVKAIPRTVGILHRVFTFISSEELTPTLEWIIDDIAEVLAQCDLASIIDGFHKDKQGKDPLVHFYETFLSVYDPAKREARGVYYTPESVVGFIVRSVHEILKKEFNKEDGLASRGVTLLDPATGTATFLAEAIRTAVKSHQKKYGTGTTQALVEGHILPNFIGFELLVAPYTIGHLKLALVLREQEREKRYWIDYEKRFRLYLTNTLDFELEQKQIEIGFGEREIAQEQAQAQKVKDSEKIMVVIGNPPYSGISENNGKWISEKIDDYKEVDGKPLGERKHWLNDDYVKFFRFAEWKVEQNGSGVLAYITNHSWLDNKTFRGMRAHLLKTFDEIYILNLHGNKRTKEKSPDGDGDENVFDIQAGVAIAFCIKNSHKGKAVYYADLWGSREHKYSWLSNNEIESIKWKKITPASPDYLFVPRDDVAYQKYQQLTSIKDIFNINSTGIVTGRDDFAIDMQREALAARIKVFRDLSQGTDFIKEAYKLKDKPAYKWYVEESRREISEIQDWDSKIRRILYRPFDSRWVYYHSAVIFWPREDIMQYMKDSNLGLIVTRQNRQVSTNYSLVTNELTDFHVLDNARDSTSLFPLYTFDSNGERKDNFQDQFISALKHSYPDFLPVNIFSYIYGILQTPKYQKKYTEFLKSDFPRVPITSNRVLFEKISHFGSELINLHLLRNQQSDGNLVRYEGSGHDLVEKPKYDSQNKRVWINKDKYFEGIEAEIWDFMIGGYQVMQKWLKDRSGRMLNYEEQLHYMRIAKTLAATIEIQKKLDEIYPDVEVNVISLA